MSLAAGATSGGAPYLLIGVPGEGRESPTTIWNHGAVYYLRSGSVSVIHQDSPGVPGLRETGDYFGESLAVSGRYFVIGTIRRSSTATCSATRTRTPRAWFTSSVTP
jgi:CRP-like cAMP-binding protein